MLDLVLARYANFRFSTDFVLAREHNAKVRRRKQPISVAPLNFEYEVNPHRKKGPSRIELANTLGLATAFRALHRT